MTVKLWALSNTERKTCLLAFTKLVVYCSWRGFPLTSLVCFYPWTTYSTVGAEICRADLLTVWDQHYTFMGVYLLFRSTNGKSCCRGNTSSLWRVWGKEKPVEWHPAVFWAAVRGLSGRKQGASCDNGWEVHRTYWPLSCQTIYLIVSRRTSGRGDLWDLVTLDLHFKPQEPDISG